MDPVTAYGQPASVRRLPTGLVVPRDLLQDDVLLRALAALSGDVALYATVDVGADGSCRLAVGPHEPGCVRRLVVVRGTAVYDGSDWRTLADVHDESACSSDPPTARSAQPLAEAAVPCATAHSPHAARIDEELLALAAGTARRTLPAVTRSLPLDAAHAAHAGQRLDIATALDGLRDLQHQARRLYGELEPERALSWFLEELGELAQAVRRAEPSARIEEELGQVAAWCLCMANITRVDLGVSLSRALHEEHSRQLSTYGELRPYTSQEMTA
ncbi:MazG nucleotide pyrophosphohydrolase domain-containing protein [Streptomyces sp. NPDC088812]|uniref:MazG nucleotide pyrophosphohydrolase domain-containing protein n=1 Tax=Streptomyces sp. NPDC088812 TaxID=3365905 RepID=UPI00381217A8